MSAISQSGYIENIASKPLGKVLETDMFNNIVYTDYIFEYTQTEVDIAIENLNAVMETQTSNRDILYNFIIVK